MAKSGAKPVEAVPPPDDVGKPTCFVISPIGKPDSEERKRSDQVLKHIIAPAIEACGYSTPPLRADHLPNPGVITKQIIQHLLSADLVIADLTGHNPNVFYELAVRHATRKPIVQIIHSAETIPFDVGTQRTIHYDHHDLDKAEQAKADIVKQIEAIRAIAEEVDNPISDTLLFQSLTQSDEPLKKSQAEILATVSELHSMVSALQNQLAFALSYTPASNDLYKAAFYKPNISPFVSSLGTRRLRNDIQDDNDMTQFSNHLAQSLLNAMRKPAQQSDEEDETSGP